MLLSILLFALNTRYVLSAEQSAVLNNTLHKSGSNPGVGDAVLMSLPSPCMPLSSEERTWSILMKILLFHCSFAASVLGYEVIVLLEGCEQVNVSWVDMNSLCML